MRALGNLLLLLLPASAPTVVAKIGTDLHPCGAAAGRGSVWVAAYDSGRLLRINTETNRLATRQISRVPIGHAGGGFLAALAGSLWTTTADGYAVRIDPRTRRVIAPFRIRGTPADVAEAPDGLVWVAEKERDTITRIDPLSNKVVDVTPAGNGALTIVRAAGDMWVTNFAGTDLWRFDAG